MTRVKVCGFTDEDDVAAAVDAGVDAVGVVCDVPVDTPREVSTNRARHLLDAVPPFVASVLVTMPETPAQAIELVDRIGPDVLQIHGEMTHGDVAYLSAKLDVRIVKSVDAATPEIVRDYADVADGLLVDSVGDAGGGGTGETHDWERTRAATRDVETPVVLAGGLTPENVTDAIATVDPYCVDVASGVEAAPGEKDHEAVSTFVRRAKRRREATA